MFGIQFAAAWAGGFHPATLALVIGNISALQRGLYCTRVHVQCEMYACERIMGILRCTEPGSCILAKVTKFKMLAFFQQVHKMLRNWSLVDHHKRPHSSH